MISRGIVLNGVDGKERQIIKYEYAEDCLTLFDYFGIKEQKLDKATAEVSYPDRSTIAGEWGVTLAKEYTVLVFENNTMKQYVYNKDNKSQVLAYKNLGEFRLKNDWLGNRDMVAYNIDSLLTPTENYRYWLDGDELTLKLGDLSTTYQRIK